MAIDLQSTRYRTDVQNKQVQTRDLLPIVNDLEALDGSITGNTTVAAPFIPDNSIIVVGDNFQEVAEKAQGQIDAIITDITNLGNNEIKLAYYAEINTASGTIAKPTGSTIMLDQFYGGVDAVVSTIVGGKPTGEMPRTAGGALVDVTSFDASGNYTLSGLPSGFPCALIYNIKISAANYANVNLNYVIEYAEVGVTEDEINLSDVTTNNSTATKHGFLPKLSNVNTQYLNGQGNWATPSGIVNSFSTTTFTNQTSINVVHGFGVYPVVQVVDSTGAVVIPLSITNNTLNDFTVTFSVATTGTILATVGSPQAQTFISVSGNYNVLTTDRIILQTAAPTNVTLPTAIGNTGRMFTITNGSSGLVTVDTLLGQTLSGLPTVTLAPTDSLDVYSDGANYYIS